MKITRFDRATCRELGARMAELLKPLEAEFGVQLAYTGGTYDSTEAKLAIRFKAGDEKTAIERARNEFALYAGMYGLSKEDFGKTFLFNGKPYKLTGLNPSAPKYPIEGKSMSTGKPYRFPRSAIASIKSAAA